MSNELAIVHPIFHVYMIKKFIREPTSIFPLQLLELMKVFLMKKLRLIF